MGKNMLNNKNYLSAALIICFNCITFSLLNLPLASKYEISIYASTPTYLWFSIIISIVTSICILIYFTLTGYPTSKLIQKSSVILIYLCTIIILSLFIIRGYYLWCMNGDPASHLRNVNYILFNSRTPNELFYPALHIYSAEFILLSGISITQITKFLPLWIGSLYLPFMYIFSKQLIKDTNILLLSTLASSVLLVGWYLNFTPNGLANLLFPLILFCIFKKWGSKDYRWSILVVILALFYPIFHQLPALIFAITLISLPLPCIGVRYWGKKDHFIFRERIPKLSGHLVLLIFVWGLAWFSSFYMWKYLIINLNQLIMEEAPNNLNAIISTANYAQNYGYNVIEQVLKQLGGHLIYLILAIFSIPFLLRDYSGKIYINKFISLYGPLFSIGIFTLALFFLNLPFGPLRLITYIFMFSSPLVGYFFWIVLNQSPFKSFKSISLFIISSIFILIWINSIFIVYPSPYTLSTNYHTPLSEVKGMEWLFENRVVNYEITGITIAPYRFGEFLLNDTQRQIQHLHWVQPENLKIPNHFGYDNTSSLDCSFNKTLYIGINEKDTLIYRELFPEMAHLRFTGQDFEKLDGDTSLYNIYTNNGFRTYYLNVKKGEEII